jgi:hypothetical protein
MKQGTDFGCTLWPLHGRPRWCENQRRCCSGNAPRGKRNDVRAYNHCRINNLLVSRQKLARAVVATVHSDAAYQVTIHFFLRGAIRRCPVFIRVYLWLIFFRSPATPTAALPAAMDRAAPARCGCPGSNGSGQIHKKIRTRAGKPVPTGIPARDKAR